MIARIQSVQMTGFFCNDRGGREMDVGNGSVRDAHDVVLRFYDGSILGWS